MTFAIPKDFFSALRSQPPIYRLLWIEWLAVHHDVLTEPDFCERLQYEKTPIETVKAAHQFGMQFFKEGVKVVKEGKRSQTVKIDENTRIIAQAVLDYLNSKAGTTFTTRNEATLKAISARLHEGYSFPEFKIVIDKKTAQWLGTEQEVYLRPITLFQASKFEQYLNEIDKTHKHERSTKQERNQSVSGIQALGQAVAKAKEFDFGLG